MNPVLRWLQQLHPRALARRAALFVARPEPGAVDFGDLGRLTPISDSWGFDRGTPIDRYYIEQFLAEHERDIGGHVLEIGDDRYTRQYGRTAVTRSDVLQPKAGPDVTIVGDLTRTDDFAPEQFDCVLLIQTLPFVADPDAAVRTAHHLLKPGGILLATTSGIARVSPYDAPRWGHFHHLTRFSARRLFDGVFGSGRAEIQSVGNVLTAAAFLYGIAAEELAADALSWHDPDFEVLLQIRAQKST